MRKSKNPRIAMIATRPATPIPIAILDTALDPETPLREMRPQHAKPATARPTPSNR